jgi:hypothetical protein
LGTRVRSAVTIEAGSDLATRVKVGGARVGRVSAVAREGAFAYAEPSEPESEKLTEGGFASTLISAREDVWDGWLSVADSESERRAAYVEFGSAVAGWGSEEGAASGIAP